MVTLPIELIELEKNNYHLILKGYFSDEVEMYWIIDTGASKTVVNCLLTDYVEEVENSDEVEFQSAGIQEGMMDTKVGKLSIVHFGKFCLENQPVALIDLSHVNRIYRRYCDREIAGLLGSDVLNQFGCIINFGKKTISFYPDAGNTLR